MGSVSETELASLCYNCKAIIPLRIALQEMGHPQPKNPVVIDNSTTEDLVTKATTVNRAKHYDFRTNWVKCREAQHQFDIIGKG